MNTIAVIGGGAAGIMAAVAAAKNPLCHVVLIEKNEKIGKKMLITGGGRCNITNTDDALEMIDKVQRNPRFLYSALCGLNSAAMCEFLHNIGIATKTEDGGRVFPVSDNSLDIVNAFEAYLRKLKVKLMLNCDVTEISKEEPNDFIVKTGNGGIIKASAVIIATGGLAAPNTGSTGDGYKFAQKMGHDVTKLHPALVPLISKESFLKDLTGLSFSGIGLAVEANGKKIYKDRGDIIITHFGLSGPMVLRASSRIADINSPVRFYLDFMPDEDENDVDKHILDIINKNLNKDIINALEGLLPERLLPVILQSADVKPYIKARDITKDKRRRICSIIKGFCIEISGNMGFGGAVITCGGVSCKEINPKTMESKLITCLYFAGEVMDVDAFTGGYNLQIAFSTGYLAGKSAAGGF